MKINIQISLLVFTKQKIKWSEFFHLKTRVVRFKIVGRIIKQSQNVKYAPMLACSVFKIESLNKIERGLKERRTDHKILLIGEKDTHKHVHKIKNYIKLRKDARPSTDL